MVIELSIGGQLIIKSAGAVIALGEAAAEAVQRIPDARCSGDMRAALA